MVMADGRFVADRGGVMNRDVSDPTTEPAGLRDAIGQSLHKMNMSYCLCLYFKYVNVVT